MMIRAVRLLPRPADQSDPELRWNWLLKHGPVAREAVAQSEIARITASFATPEQIVEYGAGHQVPVRQDFEAEEAVYFPTFEQLRSALASGVLSALDASLDTVLPGASAVPRVITIEETMARRPDAEAVLGANPRTKLLRTLKRKPDIDLVQFRDYWHNHHRIIEMLGVYMGGLPLILVSFALGQTIDGDEIRDIEDRDGLMDLDGVIEIFSAPGVDALSGYRLPFPATIRRDELNFLSMDAPIRRVQLQEHVLAGEEIVRGA